MAERHQAFTECFLRGSFPAGMGAALCTLEFWWTLQGNVSCVCNCGRVGFALLKLLLCVTG